MPTSPDMTTRLQRTAQAWRLLPHPHTLSRKAHALLVLANGHRSVYELSLLVGANVGPLVLQLVEQGLLQHAQAEPAVVH